MNDKLLPLPNSASLPEQRSACLLVADLVGSTDMAHRLPLAHYVSLMSEMIQLLYLHLGAYGGQVLQHQGDGVVCLWDAAQTGSALWAAQEAHVRVARLGLAAMLGERLQLRIGLALGEVLLLPVGGMPSAYGLPVNKAQRLSSAALAGQTLACPAVVRAVPSLITHRQTVQGLPGFPQLDELHTVLEALCPPAQPSAARRGSGQLKTEQLKTGQLKAEQTKTEQARTGQMKTG